MTQQKDTKGREMMGDEALGTTCPQHAKFGQASGRTVQLEAFRRSSFRASGKNLALLVVIRRSS
jgi:hypothetical protein